MKKINKKNFFNIISYTFIDIGIIYFYNYKVIEKYKNRKYKICILINDKIKDYADKCYEINKKYCKKYDLI